MPEHPIFLRQVGLKNYMSIADCSVKLGKLNFLVGPNGAGKSNFLDALRFTSEALGSILEKCIQDRGGISHIYHQPDSLTTGPIEIKLSWRLPNGDSGEYEFKISGDNYDNYNVDSESCQVTGSDGRRAFFEVQDGKVVHFSPASAPPAASADRLYLVSASGQPEFRPIYDALERMQVYHFNGDVIKEFKKSAFGTGLAQDGRNLAAVLERMDSLAPEKKERIVQYMRKILPDLKEISIHMLLADWPYLLFKQEAVGPGGAERVSFEPRNISDGTLRALAVLTALFQVPAPGGKIIPLVGIEEPETALHPGAAGVLRAALLEASENTQVLVTSHSPDLLDDKDISADSLIAVKNIGGKTILGAIDEASRSMIKDRLMTAGELLRLNQLEVAEEIAANPSAGHGSSVGE